MKHKLLTILTALTLLLIPNVALTAAAGACPSSPSDAQSQVLNGISQTGSNCSGGGVDSAIKAAVNILTLVVGIAAIVMIVYSGFRYITSAGDSNRVSAAKSTLIYAIIGLAIIGLSQVLVHWVLTTSTNATTPCPSNSSLVITDAKCK